jgi:hypothetical protein
MSNDPESNDERPDERPCLHCLIGDLIDEFYAEYGSTSGEKDTLDMDEIISAIGKIIAEMTFGSDPTARQRILEDLTREIAKFEAEYASAPGSDVRH